ncbi:MAG: leucine-rich repeat domain-containing protein [Candidatus Thorarchaeota archaeon]
MGYKLFKKKIEGSGEDLDYIQLLELSGKKCIGSKGNGVENDFIYLKKPLEFLPDSIGKLTQLEYLCVKANNITKLPNSIGDLKKLRILKVDEQGIPDFNDKKEVKKRLSYYFTLTEIKKVKEFYSQRTTALEELSKSIGTLANLRFLSLSFNKLKSLPESIGNLKSLEILDLAFNQLTYLPESIGNLTSLHILYLQGNELSSLPESFYKLKNLKTLWLYHNKFREIPYSIWNLDKLEKSDPFPLYYTMINDNLCGLDNFYFLAKTSFSNFLISDPLYETNPLSEESKSLLGRIMPAILEYCRKKANISIFISHAMDDFEKYHIKEHSNYLEQQDEVYKAYYCEEDLRGNIDEFMDMTIPECDVLLFIATQNSVHSVDCRHEIELAQKLKIKIMPLKDLGIEWGDLRILGIDRELGMDYNLIEFNDFCGKLYKYLYTYKRDENFRRKTSNIAI